MKYRFDRVSRAEIIRNKTHLHGAAENCAQATDRIDAYNTESKYDNNTIAFLINMTKFQLSASKHNTNYVF